jgi:hypothetical protein
MPRTTKHSPRRSRSSCSVIALATVMAVGATPAAAQSLLGTGSYVTNPNATGITTGPGTTTINLNGGQTVIDWTPTDNAINPGNNIVFQNSGTTALFTGSSDFAVLNRVLPADISRAIIMNGTVNSRVGGSQRGSVYFYSPSGFIFGGSSVFSVGSLVVTASPITLTGSNFINGNTVVFGQALNPSAVISSAGTISASSAPIGIIPPGQSYVAMVAPLVQHSGTITVNGSTALVGAEAATINFSPDGLFDIQVTVGTTSSSGVNVSGDIAGPQPTGPGDTQGVFLVAVPKNDALTMVISNGADLGFTLANDATIDAAGVVVLSAGHDIVDGQIGPRSAGHGANATADFWFTGAHATNNLFGEATGSAYLYSVTGPNLTTTFDSDVTVHATNNLWMNTSGLGTSLTVAGDLSLSTDAFASSSGGSATGGNTQLYALNSGILTVDGDVSLSANGFGGSSESSGIAGGNGTGGEVVLQASDTGLLHVLGNVSAQASGFGGDGFNAVGGGIGQGGSVSMWAQGGTVTLDGALSAYAQGQGGDAYQSGAVSGAGTGGGVSVQGLSSGLFSVAGNTIANADGSAGLIWGNGAIGGDGRGGGITVQASGTNAALGLGGNVDLSAQGNGGVVGEGLVTSAGGDGTGGDIIVSANGTNADLTIDLDLDATADGWGGAGVDAVGGIGEGGTINISASNDGTLHLIGGLDATADGHGGAWLDGNGGNLEAPLAGNGIGGETFLQTFGTGAADMTIDGSAFISAVGSGGNVVQFATGTGGDGFGGRTRVIAETGTIHVLGNLDLDSSASGGNGANGGDAVGIVTPESNEALAPAAFLWAGEATAELRVDGLTTIDVGATGGAGSNGGGGNASAGELDIASRQGDVLLGALDASAEAEGGDGGNGGTGGNALGGNIDIAWALEGSLTGLISADSVDLSVSGIGGAGGDGLSANTGGNGGAGGSGTGGHVTVVGSAAGGRLDVGATAILASGTGGSGGAGGTGDTGSGGNGGNGGIGTGGLIQTGTFSNELNTGSGGSATYTNLVASSSASGGAGGAGGSGGGGTGIGGDGGDAIAGQANFLARGVLVTADLVNLSANAVGGNGGSGSTLGNGGDAFAGFVSVESKDRFGHPTQRGTLVANTITGTAFAQGGSGAVAGTSTVRGGSFFRVLNGDATIGTLSFTFTGQNYDGALGPNYIQAQDGTATIGNFNYTTTGDLAVYTTSTGSLNVGSLSLSAGNFVDHPTLPGPAAPGTIFATSMSVVSADNFIADANLDVDNGINIAVPGSIRFNNAVSSSFVDLWAQGGSIAINNVNAGSYATLIATGSVNAGNILAGGNINVQALGGDIGLGSVTSTFGNVFAGATGGLAFTGDVLADGVIDLNADGLVDIRNAIAGESVDLDAGGNVLALNLTGGDSVKIAAGGSVSVGNLSAGLVNPSFSEGADYVATIAAGGNILAGNIEAASNVGLATPGAMTTGDIDAGGTFIALGHGDMSFGDATATEVFLADFAFVSGGGSTISGTCVGACGTLGPNGVVIAPPTGSSYSYVTTEAGITGGGQIPGEGGTNGSLYTTNEFSAAAGDALEFWFNYVTSDGSGFADYAWAGLFTASLDPVAILFTARTQPTGTIVPGQNLPGVEATLTPSSVPIIDGAPAWSPLGTSSGSCYSAGCGFTGWINSTYDIAEAGNYVVRFGVSNWSDTAFQSGMAFAGITVGGVSVTPGVARTGGSISIGNVDTGKFTAAAGTSLTTGIIDSGGAISLDAGGAITTSNLFAGDFVLANGGSITTGNVQATSIDMTSTGGNIATQALSADGDIALDAFANLSFASGNAGGEFDFSVGGSVSGGNVVAGNEISGDAGGSVNLGNLTAGLPQDDDFSVGILAASGISVGNVNANGPAGFATTGNLTTGNITAGDGFLALVGGNVTTGAIATTGAGGGEVYIGDDSMFFAAGGTADGEGNFDPTLVLALAPVATGGSITINGPVNTGLFRAAAGTSLVTQAITADEIEARAVGTAAINGLWSAALVTLTSNDINIGATGGIAAGAGGEVNLRSSNTQRMLIGDGLTLTGYALSNAEFSRISGGDIAIIAGGMPGAAADTLIGSLTVTAGPTGNIRSANGGVAIVGLDEAGTARDGTMRIVGSVTGSGFTNTNYLAFATQNFQLDVGTGSVSLTSSGSTLGGELDLFADRIHVATGTILNQLAANPTYSGYQQDLNRTATVQRPDGVLRAATLWIESDTLQDILIQNTGTVATPAGFLVNEAFINDDALVAGPPGSINLIVNGQVVTADGTLMGIAARDALTLEADLSPFTANSTINGCPLSGPCVIAPEPPELIDRVDIPAFDVFGDSDFGNEPDIDDGQEGDAGANNPITPPQPLFDTRPLVPASDVNDPVSGTGNPSLLGSSDCSSDDDEGQCAAEKEDGQ